MDLILRAKTLISNRFSYIACHPTRNHVFISPWKIVSFFCNQPFIAIVAINSIRIDKVTSCCHEQSISRCDHHRLNRLNNFCFFPWIIDSLLQRIKMSNNSRKENMCEETTQNLLKKATYENLLLMNNK